MSSLTSPSQSCRQMDLDPDAYSDNELSVRPGQHIHPREWGKARKIYDTCLITFLEFFTTMISTTGAPIAAHIYRDLGLSPVTATCAFVSTYLIGQTIGGVFFPPWSESFGRKKLYVFSTVLYSLSCVFVGMVPTIPGIIVGRFIGGLFSSVPTIVSTGSIEDMWDAHSRVWSVFLWALVANIGLLTGPVFGDLILAHSHWKWAFYTAAIVTGCLAALLLTIKESRPSVVAAKAKSSSDIQHATARASRREKLDLLRPLRLFFTEPIVFLVTILSAIAFGLVYLFTEVLPMVYIRLGFDDGWKNLPFLALGIGMLLSGITRIYDRHVIARRTAASLPITPESKFAGFVIGSLFLAAGLWWFAWTIPPRVTVHWIIPTVALVPVGFAVNEFDYVLAGYLTDCYQSYAASGFAALALVRSLFCATFPIFGRIMFESLDFNMATTLFAALATTLCIVPPMLIRYGSWLRDRSSLASK